MENKNIKYLLGVAVLAIWGLLGYRVYQKMTAGNFFFIPPADEVFFADAQNDSFTVLVNYRDPFLGGKLSIPDQTPAVATPPSNQQISTVVPRQVNGNANRNQPFPQIIYKGLIDLKTGRKAALVNVKGKTMNWGWGENHEKMTLVDIYEDSIRVKYGEMEKVILKGQ